MPVSGELRLAAVRQPNDWTELTLPDANPYDGSRLGPLLPVGCNELRPECADPRRAAMGEDHGLSGPQRTNGSTGLIQAFSGDAFSAASYA